MSAGHAWRVARKDDNGRIDRPSGERMSLMEVMPAAHSGGRNPRATEHIREAGERM